MSLIYDLSLTAISLGTPDLWLSKRSLKSHLLPKISFGKIS